MEQGGGVTIPVERSLAVLHAEIFLLELASGKIKRIPKAVRERARAVLRHYPNRYDVDDLAKRFPDRWGMA